MDFVSFNRLDHLGERRVWDSTGRQQPGKPGVKENDRLLEDLNL